MSQPFVAFAAALGVEPHHLDEVVHDAKSREATDINNRGLAAQIAYLGGALGPRALEALLRELAVNAPSTVQP